MCVDVIYGDKPDIWHLIYFPEIRVSVLLSELQTDLTLYHMMHVVLD